MRKRKKFFYNNLDYRVDDLKAMLKTTLTYTCKIPSCSDNRKRLISKYQTMNKDFVSCIHRSLNLADRHCVSYHLSQCSDDRVICKILDLNVTVGIFRCLQDGISISNPFMEIVVRLFRLRCSRILETYTESYGHLLNHQPLKKSVFYIGVEHAIHELGEKIVSNTPIRCGYILCRAEGGMWFLLYIDMEKHVIFLLHPTFGPLSEVKDFLLEKMQPDLDRLQTLLQEVCPDHPYRIEPYKYQYYDKLESDCNSGILVMLMIYHLELRCPIVCNASHYNKFRTSLGYWVLIGHLPY